MADDNVNRTTPSRSSSSRGGVGRTASGESVGGNNRGSRTMNAPTSMAGARGKRGMVKRNHSFQRTSAGAAATTADSNADLAADLVNFDTKPEPRGGGGGAMAASASSSTGFGSHTSTSNFVKNFLEEDDDPNLAGGSSNSGIQFDAGNQRNVHSSLLAPTPDSPTGSPERARRTMNLNVSSSLHSRNGRLGGNSGHLRSGISQHDPNASLFQQRDGFNYVDQSVNLMDAEAGKYESKDRNRGGIGGNATSMVEIFLKDSGAAVSEEITKTTQWWHHPQRREQWNRMSTWEKIKEVSARLILPLACCALIFIVILCILTLYNKVETAAENSGMVNVDIPAPADNDEIPGKPQAMQAVGKQLVQLKLATPEQIKDTSSPSYKALDWISTDEIALNGSPDQGRRTRALQESQDRLVQRYVLAVLHFTWNGQTNNGKALADNAIQNMGLLPGASSEASSGFDDQLWLTPQSECNWKGVQCHDEAKNIDVTVEATQVRALNLTQHGLEGTLPMEVSFLSNLVELDLRKNKLNGNLASLKWNQWSKMEYLLLGSNEFTGRIPEEIGEMQRLVDLDLSDNELTGLLPGLAYAQGKMEFMENVFVDGNALTGAIPGGFLKAMPHLNYLDLSENVLTGNIPPAIAELSQLRYLHAINNALTGTLPIEMAGMERMDTLSLDDNKLSGPLPEGIFSGMTRLRYMRMNGNSFDGPLPESVADMSKLQDLDLSENGFTGTIPSSWFDGAKDLVTVVLSKNKLTGTVPSSIGNLAELQTLHLDGNELSGEVPSGLCEANPVSVVVDCKSGDITCDCCERCV